MKPVQTFRDGAIGLSVWERTGSKGSYFEFTISRSYKNKDGKSAYSGSFREYDAASLRTVIDQAVAHIRGRSEGQTGEVAKQSESAQDGDEAVTTPLDAVLAGDGL